MAAWPVAPGGQWWDKQISMQVEHLRKTCAGVCSLVLVREAVSTSGERTLERPEAKHLVLNSSFTSDPYILEHLAVG